MNPFPAETNEPISAPIPVRRPMLSAILTDIHFWIPVVVLAFGVGLLVYIS